MIGAGGSPDVPIDPEEGQYLRPELAGVYWRSEVFELEALNLADARIWLATRPARREELLTQSFQHELHRRMYGAVWTWAGARRVRENNIGINPQHIADRWEQLLGNVGYWLDQGTFHADEACIRYSFEQREIQPFHDGNSRLGRFVVNKLAELSGLEQPGRARYPFGRGEDPRTVREEYLVAMSGARRGHFGPLVDLARRGGSGLAR
jgi:fido (protein-threonine AMPylation protein)